MPKLPIDEWLPENLRLTIFPSPDSILSFKPDEWWQAVTGLEPEQVSIAKRGTSSVDGPYVTGKLLLRSVTDRIDWLFAPADSTIENLVLLGNPTSIGPINDVIGAFVDVVEKWFRRADIPDISRMAFGAVLGHPTEDHKRAYIDLMEYIPVKVDTSSMDLMFQVNLPPVDSTHVSGLKFNRLSKWMVVQATVVAVPVVVTGGVPLVQTVTPPLSIRLEVDINTLPTFPGPIPRGEIFAVFNELVGHARDIISNGVRPS